MDAHSAADPAQGPIRPPDHLDGRSRSILSDQIREQAKTLGFDLVGICPAIEPEGHTALLRWLRAGREAGMDYMSRHVEARRHPDAILEGVRSLILVGFVYGGGTDPEPTPRQGKVARYARGRDYHKLLWKRLEALLNWLVTRVPTIRGRAVADTAPLLERDFARLAGLGWIAKNTMLINKHLGSYTVLGALLIDQELEYDQPHQTNHCGTCTRCLEACPTDAFPTPGVLDANRCISYWTIEHRGPIPEPWANQLAGWVFGCDICQEVCPWNRKAPPGRTAELAARSEWTNPDLIAWLEEPAERFQSRLRGTAQKRAKRAGLLRNAALVLGTRGDGDAREALIARRDDSEEDPTIREAAAWALLRLADREQADFKTSVLNSGEPAADRPTDS